MIKIEITTDDDDSWTPCRPGCVYRSKGGGRRRGIHYHVIVAVDRRMAHFFITRENGEIIGSGTYGVHVFDGGDNFPGRKLVGFCPQIADMNVLEVHPV